MMVNLGGAVNAAIGNAVNQWAVEGGGGESTSRWHMVFMIIYIEGGHVIKKLV